MLKPEVLDALVDAGCTAEQIAAVVKADMASDKQSDDYRRESDRLRKQVDRELRLPEKDWIPLRARVLARAEYRCVYCSSVDGPWCADHVVPLSRGGTNDESNLAACCLPCNSSKGNLLLSEWRGRRK